MRHIVQVIAVQTHEYGDSDKRYNEYTLYALCNDGTLWRQHYDEPDGDWRHVPTDVIARTTVEVAHGTQA